MCPSGVVSTIFGPSIMSLENSCGRLPERPVVEDMGEGFPIRDTLGAARSEPAPP